MATGAATYTWTPATGLSCTACPNPIATPTSTTTYIVTGVDTNGCESSDSVKVTIKDKPTITVTPDTTICEGSSIPLQATGATTYTWSPATGLSCTTCPNPIATPITTTMYTVIGVNAVGCSDTATVTITVNTKPNVDAGADNAICPGDSTLLVATGATTYLWTPGATLSCDTCDSTYATPAATTTYTVIGSLANGCSDTDMVTVTVNALPNIYAGPDTTVCVGTTIQLQATGGITYTWSPATGLSCTSCSNPMANPKTTTTYTVIGTDTNGCKNTDSVKITINPLPNVNAGNDVDICLNDSVQLQATGASTYMWTPSTGLGCTSCANPKAGPTVTTTYTVTGTDGNGCVNSDTVTVTIKALPTVNAGADRFICTGDTALLIATGATTYLWTPGATLTCDTCDSTYASPTVNTTYTVIGTLANGCSDTDMVTVTVNALPNIYAGPDSTVCVGTTIQLLATGGSTYTWSPSTGLSCTSCSNPMANPTVTTTYTVTGTDTNGCKNTGDVKITINSLPNVNAGSDVNICLNDSVQLQATGATTYMWTPSTGLGCTSCSNPKAGPGVSITYTVTGTDGNGCVNKDSVQVTVKALPIVNAGADKAICPGDTAQLQATGAASYEWTPTTWLTCNTCANPKASPLFTTTYIVKGTAANGCKGTDTVDVVVYTLPVISAGPDMTMCIGDTLQLQATGGATYVWSPAIGLTCTGCANPRTGIQVDTTYIVVGTDTNGCKNTDSVKISIKPLPALVVTAGRDSICAGDTTAFLVTGATSYVWTPAGGLSCSNCTNPISTPLSTTTYTVTGTLNGCTDTASIRLFVHLNPVLATPQNVELCEGDSTTLYVKGAFTYVWSPASGLSCTGCDSPIASPLNTTKYTVKGTDSFGCTGSTDVDVVVNKLPEVDAGPDVTICDGDSVQLQAKGGIYLVWSPPDGLSCSACSNPKSGTSQNRTHTVTGIDGKGCKNTDEMSITVIKKDPITFSDGDSICIGESTSIWAAGGTSYKWLPEGGLQSPNAATTDAAPVVTTNYKVIVKQGECFTDTGDIKVTVFNKPTVELGKDQTVSGGTKIILEPDVTNVARYEWTPTDELSCYDCSNPELTALRTTTYNLKVYSDFGCTAEDDVTVYVTCGGDQVFIPNTFTPNGDGLNDRFYPQGRGAIQVKRFSVFNRWGQLIYDVQNISLNDEMHGWDGTYKSEPLQPDVFVYIIKAVCETGEPLDMKGDISLVR
ncbi:MAG: gliding motility-associated C-terminal domain-containing protein [Chitinophagaceae bacterium]|nr:gliding motility-associated C-terminal domain-containing protein [Chitinophagaceae bacterium]